jgi:hypothetical protein
MCSKSSVRASFELLFWRSVLYFPDSEASRTIIRGGCRRSGYVQKNGLQLTLYISFVMKKSINRPEDVVEEMLRGLDLFHPGSVRLPEYRVMVRTDSEQARTQQVAVLSGGGSSHEPARPSYIGVGMLSAAVIGEVFTQWSGPAA